MAYLENLWTILCFSCKFWQILQFLMPWKTKKKNSKKNVLKDEFFKPRGVFDSRNFSNNPRSRCWMVPPEKNDKIETEKKNDKYAKCGIKKVMRWNETIEQTNKMPYWWYCYELCVFQLLYFLYSKVSPFTALVSCSHGDFENGVCSVFFFSLLLFICHSFASVFVTFIVFVVNFSLTASRKYMCSHFFFSSFYSFHLLCLTFVIYFMRRLTRRHSLHRRWRRCCKNWNVSTRQWQWKAKSRATVVKIVIVSLCFFLLLEDLICFCSCSEREL